MIKWKGYECIQQKRWGQIHNTTMNVIINNGVTSNVNLDNPPESNFIIKDFNYNSW